MRGGLGIFAPEKWEASPKTSGFLICDAINCLTVFSHYLTALCKFLEAFVPEKIGDRPALYSN